jgi:hypothetical protein
MKYFMKFHETQVDVYSSWWNVMKCHEKVHELHEISWNLSLNFSWISWNFMNIWRNCFSWKKVSWTFMKFILFILSYIYFIFHYLFFSFLFFASIPRGLWNRWRGFWLYRTVPNTVGCNQSSRHSMYEGLHTLLKKRQGTLSIRLNFYCPTIMLICPGAPTPWLWLSYQWTMLTVKTSMFHFQCIILSKTCWDKTAEAAVNSHMCQLLSVFQRSVTQSRVTLAAHQAVRVKAGVCCVHVCFFCFLIIFTCIVSAVLSICKIL